MKLLFDATELSYYEENSGHRAGVFYVALNLLKEFQKQGLNITFHCDFRRYYYLKKIKLFQVNAQSWNKTVIFDNIISISLDKLK